MYKISVLLPSAYPDKRKNFIRNLRDKSADFYSLEICVCLDGTQENWEDENIRYTYHKPTQFRSKFFESCYRISTAPWIFLANDDIEIRTDNWDEIILSLVKDEDPWKLFYFNDNDFKENFSCHPFTSRRVWELMDSKGLVFPEFVNMGCDTSIWDVIPRQKRFYVPSIEIEHKRHLDDKKMAEMEEDYKRYANYKDIREQVRNEIVESSGLQPEGVLVGLSTGEYIRKADFLPSFLGLEKPAHSFTTTVHGQSPAKARNAIIQQALDNNCSHIFFMDDDMVMPQNTLLRLMTHDVDAVSGLYLMRMYPHFPVAFDEVYENGYNRYLCLRPDISGLIEVTNAGLGCVLINTRVFRKMAKPWVTLGEIDKDGWGDDISFFNRMRKAGFKLFLDTDIRVGHMATVVLWPNKINNKWLTEYRVGEGSVGIPQPTMIEGENYKVMMV